MSPVFLATAESLLPALLDGGRGGSSLLLAGDDGEKEASEAEDRDRRDGLLGLGV